MSTTNKFEFQALPYSYDALEPFIDQLTLEIKKQFSDAGKTRFGSGWVWLILDDNSNLFICSTPNQDNPLMDIAEKKGIPLLTMDVWEHAYYLKYQNKRADYADSFWNVVNWDEVAKRYETGLKSISM